MEEEAGNKIKRGSAVIIACLLACLLPYVMKVNSLSMNSLKTPNFVKLSSKRMDRKGSRSIDHKIFQKPV